MYMYYVIYLYVYSYVFVYLNSTVCSIARCPVFLAIDSQISTPKNQKNKTDSPARIVPKPLRGGGLVLMGLNHPWEQACDEW